MEAHPPERCKRGRCEWLWHGDVPGAFGVRAYKNLDERPVARTLPVSLGWKEGTKRSLALVTSLEVDFGTQKCQGRPTALQHRLARGSHQKPVLLVQSGHSNLPSAWPRLPAANDPLGSFVPAAVAFHPKLPSVRVVRTSAVKTVQRSCPAAAVVETTQTYTTRALSFSPAALRRFTTPPENGRRFCSPAPRPPRRKSLWLPRSRRTPAGVYPRPPRGLVCPSR